MTATVRAEPVLSTGRRIVYVLLLALWLVVVVRFWVFWTRPEHRGDLALWIPATFAFAYLLIFGSLAGYTAFVYLLQVSTPTKVGTYAYVNPMVAVFLGWAFGGEPVTPRILTASAVILSAVALITTFENRELPQAITRWTRESRVPPPPAADEARDGDKRRTEDCAITEVA